MIINNSFSICEDIQSTYLNLDHLNLTPYVVKGALISDQNETLLPWGLVNALPFENYHSVLSRQKRDHKNVSVSFCNSSIKRILDNVT